MPNTLKFDQSLVVRKAAEVFQEKGYNGTSIQDLVDATGLNRSSIYNSFGSKLKLYTLALEGYKKDTQELTADSMMESNTALEAIKKLFSLYIDESLKDTSGKGCMINSCMSEMASSGEQSILTWLNRSQQENLAAFEELLAKGQNDGSINTNQSPKQYALFLLSSLQGLRMTSILQRNKKELRDLAKTYIRTLT